MDSLIINPLITLGFAIAMVVFLWGIFQFIRNPADQANREQGQKNILWGLIGLLIMFSVYGIIGIIANTFGLTVPDILLNR